MGKEEARKSNEKKSFCNKNAGACGYVDRTYGVRWKRSTILRSDRVSGVTSGVDIDHGPEPRFWIWRKAAILN